MCLRECRSKLRLNREVEEIWSWSRAIALFSKRASGKLRVCEGEARDIENTFRGIFHFFSTPC